MNEFSIYFFFYLGAIAIASLTAFLWGEQDKMTAVGVIFLSIILSNISGYLLFEKSILITADAFILIAVDTFALCVFLYLYQVAWRKNLSRWLLVLAGLSATMFSINAAALFYSEFGSSYLRFASLNVLTFVSIVVCIVARMPRSIDEAKGIIRAKWLYFKMGYLSRVRLASKEHANSGRK